MFKESVYKKVVQVLNEETTSGLKFDSGYDVVFLQNGVPNAVFTNTESKFDWSLDEVIPVAEEISQETPSVNDSDRADYVFQYQLMFRLNQLDNVKTALEEFRTYFFNNKTHVIDGYNVAFKVTRGDKQATYELNAGNMVGRYKITLYATASKGYITTDDDGYYIRPYNNGTYTKIPHTKTIGTFLANTTPDISDLESTYKLTSYTNNIKITAYYDDSVFMQDIYNIWIGEIGDLNEAYQVRHKFNGTFSQPIAVVVSGVSRTEETNAMALFEFDLLRLRESELDVVVV